jgi:LysM repeat protein
VRASSRVTATVATLGALCALAGCSSDSPTSTKPPRTALPPLTTAASTIAAPTTTIAKFYVIQKGDSLTSIADKFGIDLRQLIALNNIKDPDKIRAGQKLRMPPITVLLNGSTTVARPTTVTRPRAARATTAHR